MNLKSKIIALNEFLSAIYDNADAKPSFILSRIGFHSADIDLLRTKHMANLSELICDIFENQILNNKKRLFHVISLRYGLGRDGPMSLRKIGGMLGLSAERVRQLERNALLLCKDKKRIEIFEGALKNGAKSLLDVRQNSICETSEIKTGENVSAENPCELEVRKISEDEYGIFLRPKEKSAGRAILLTERTAVIFRNNLDNAMKKLGWKLSKDSPGMAQIKKKYPRAYEKWERKEDETLKSSFETGMGIDELSALLMRQPGAIKSRLQKLYPNGNTLVEV